MNPSRIHGLIAAPHTPFTSDGDLCLSAVEAQFPEMKPCPLPVWCRVKNNI